MKKEQIKDLYSWYITIIRSRLPVGREYVGERYKIGVIVKDSEDYKKVEKTMKEIFPEKRYVIFNETSGTMLTGIRTVCWYVYSSEILEKGKIYYNTKAMREDIEERFED